jgi:hypothetical protein
MPLVTFKMGKDDHQRLVDITSSISAPVVDYTHLFLSLSLSLALNSQTDVYAILLGTISLFSVFQILLAALWPCS